MDLARRRGETVTSMKVNSKMELCTAGENIYKQVEPNMSVNSLKAKCMDLEQRRIRVEPYIVVNLKGTNLMVMELLFGLMVIGMKDSSKMVIFKVSV